MTQILSGDLDMIQGNVFNFHTLPQTVALHFHILGGYQI